MSEKVTDTQTTTTPASTVTNEEKPAGEQKFTQAEMDAVISKRVNKEKENTATAIATAVETALAEERRQQALTQEQRDREQEARRQADIKAREDSLTIRENKLKAQEMLTAKGVPTDMADFVVDLDPLRMEANINKLAQSYTQSVEAGVTDKLKGKAPEDFTKTNPKDDKKKPDYSGTTAF